MQKIAQSGHTDSYATLKFVDDMGLEVWQSWKYFEKKLRQDDFPQNWGPTDVQKNLFA